MVNISNHGISNYAGRPGFLRSAMARNTGGLSVCAQTIVPPSGSLLEPTNTECYYTAGSTLRDGEFSTKGRYFNAHQRQHDHDVLDYSDQCYKILSPNIDT